MDIKALLLQSITGKQIVRGTRRLYYDKFCFIIKYEIMGKYMNILSIKRKRINDSGLYQNIKRKIRLIKKYKRAYHKWLLTNDIKKGSGDNCGKSDESCLSERKLIIKGPITSTSSMTDDIKHDKGVQSDMDGKLQQSPSATSFCIKHPQKYQSKEDKLKEQQQQQQQQQQQHQQQQQQQQEQQQQQQQQSQHQQQQSQQQQSQKYNIMQKHIGCNTIEITRKAASQQTITMVRYISNLRHSRAIKSFAFGCQTELITNNQGIQCKCKTNSMPSQTNDVLTNSVYTQVIQEDVNNVTPRLSKFFNMRSCIIDNDHESNVTNVDCFEVRDEKEAVVYMLSEIGELVLNQNHMLSNNSQLLNQLSDIALCNRQLAVGAAWSNKKKSCMCWNKNFRNQAVIPCRKHIKAPNKIVEKVSKETQCETKEMVSKATETSSDLIRPRRPKFLDKNDVAQRLDTKLKNKRIMN